MNNVNRLINFLESIDTCLVLADIGASGERWEIYEQLKPIANLLQFDPDKRDIREVSCNLNSKRKIVTLNRAVVEAEVEEVDFYLTRFPYCSSTLEPDFEKLKHYPYAEWFEIEKIQKVPAITINKAIEQTSFNHVDWIKIDTQGTEFRILKSISCPILDQLLVCDIEASLYPHYIGADTLPPIHQMMIDNDFWIVEMRPHWNTRISKKHIEQIKQRYQGKNRKIFEYSKHKEVTTLEFSYLRTIEGCKKRNYSFEKFVNLYVCHFVLGAFEYCLEILFEMEKIFNKKEIIDLLIEITL